MVLLLLAGTVDRKLIGRWKRTQTYVEDDFDLLNELLESHRGLVTTPHIAAEVSNLATSLSKQDHARFFELFAGYLRETKERSVAARDVALVDVFARLGLTDTAIVRFKRRSPLVITDDLPLALHLERQRLPVVNFNHLRNLAA
ncbi:MAG TPA: hypothetical protein VJN18_18830 [Polyangiaceae bacterium]|nr:hypothetical protein [Polyangiaceae bacterium]